MPSASHASRGEEPRFVFKGTVRKLRASAESGVKASGRTAIVRVDEVVRAPEALAEVAGHEVTVELGGRDKLAAGQQAMFFTHGWVFGDTLAVYAVEHQVMDPARAMAVAATNDPATNLATADAKSRFDSAAVVVSGQVTSVSMPNHKMPASNGMNGERLSEHEPIWRDAEIDVHAVHKGRFSGKHATVRFPASTDVLWHRSPKFQPGQQGYFMLHRAAPDSKHAMLTQATAGAKGAFTALHPADFQPFDQPGVRAFVNAGNGQQPRSRRGK